MYISALEAFCEFSGKTPSELIKQRDDELRSDDHNNRTGIRNLILDFRVDSELWKKARIYAVEHEITVRNFIERLIRLELEERRLEEKLKNSGQQKLSSI